VSIGPGRRLLAGVWLLTGLATVASLGFLAWRIVGASDGGVVPFYADAWSADGVRVQPLEQGREGLQAGDTVVAVAGRSISDWLDAAPDPAVDRPASGSSGPIDYVVQRDDATVDVAVTLRRRDVGGVLLENWSVLLFIVVLQAVAAYVLWRRPVESAAVALAVAAIGVTGSTIPWLLGLEVGDITAGRPFLLYGATAAGLYMLLWPAGALHLPLAMGAGPTGPNRRTLSVAYGIPLLSYLGALWAARVIAPTSAAWVGTWSSIQLAVIIPTIVIGLILSVRFYARATATVRSQVRWVILGGGVATLTSLSLLLGPELVTGRPLVPWSAVGLIALPLPIGIGIAILRRRLFDLEVVANRTLVYGGATIAIVAVYVGSVAVLGSVLREQGGFPASLLATGLAAVAALPVRDALQRAVNRLMYGDRDDPIRALGRLGARLEASLDPLELPTVIVRTVAESLRLPWVGLRLGSADGGGRLIAYGIEPAGQPTSLQLTSGVEIVGELLVMPRSRDEPLTTADRAVLSALAGQIGTAVHALRLTLDLVESRERLVAAREEERRRIRRDLHDGLGPTLAAIGARAELASDLGGRDRAATSALLDELRSDVGAALIDIRRLVDGLRPPALDELGLVGALRQQAVRLAPEPSVEVAAVGELPDLPAAVEVAAYRIATEAMTNASRHSGGRRCNVRLSHSNGANGRSLIVAVEDDGRGLPDQARPGIGLLSMRQRAEEIGGTCAVESTPGRGTRIVARLPLGKALAG
jgi:two-component system NarL family sensor kinase